MQLNGETSAYSWLPQVLAALVAFSCVSSGRGATPVSFNHQIRPLLAANCLKCHGGVKEAGGLNLQFRDSALKGGQSGHPAVVPGKPEEGMLLARILSKDPEQRMPRNLPALDARSIELLRDWIAQGAQWENHWAYDPPRKSGRSIDEEVGAGLKERGLALSPEADRWTLARRTSLDVVGLPPSPEAVEAFVKDTSPGAYEKWVDTLLQEEAYGERWAAVWLDLARYADSKGYEKDSFRDMWRYRDWVIEALNEDKPYRDFLIEQLAGDLLPNPTGEQIIATAFHRNTLENDEGGTDDEEFRTYAIIDRVNTTFEALQGTSMSCVQCHGHPYDPFVHREYYQLYAFFNNTADADREDSAPTRDFRSRTDTKKAEALEKSIAATQEQLREILAPPGNRAALENWARGLRPSAGTAPKPEFTALPKPVQDVLAKETWTAEERSVAERHYFAANKPEVAALYTQLDQERSALAALPVCHLPILQERPANEARVTQVFKRGNWMDKGEQVTAATPIVLNPWKPDYPTNRLGFAQWLTSPENPLTARVQVNRVWEQLFGAGLVETLEDFGTQGDAPVYQALLDDLAARFQTDLGWSQKKLLREILLSRVYRQSSRATAALLERDPGNRWLARGPRFRLSYEQLRDQALFASGLLSPKMFGRPVMPFQPPGMWQVPYAGQDWVTSPGEDRYRRGIYTFVRRSATYPSAITFDAPSREYCVVRRIRTNTPLQSLDLLNSPVFYEAAQALAKRMAEAGPALSDQFARGIRLALARPAKPEEVAVLTKLHAATAGNLTLVANAILNLDEVLNKN